MIMKAKTSFGLSLRQLKYAVASLALAVFPYATSAHSAEPITTILFQQFTPATSKFTLNASSRIVIDNNDSALISVLNDPLGWAQKLRYATGFKLDIVARVNPNNNDIYFSNKPDPSFFAAAAAATVNSDLGQSGNISKNIKDNVLDEGFQYSASAGGLTIKYNTDAGALRGFGMPFREE